MTSFIGEIEIKLIFYKVNHITIMKTAVEVDNQVQRHKKIKKYIIIIKMTLFISIIFFL